jgi:hypothetical protein
VWLAAVRVDPIAAVTLNGSGKIYRVRDGEWQASSSRRPDNIGNPSKASPFTAALSVQRSAGDQRAGRGLIRQRNGVAFCFPFNLSQPVPQLLDYG